MPAPTGYNRGDPSVYTTYRGMYEASLASGVTSTSNKVALTNTNQVQFCGNYAVGGFGEVCTLPEALRPDSPQFLVVACRCTDGTVRPCVVSIGITGIVSLLRICEPAVPVESTIETSSDPISIDSAIFDGATSSNRTLYSFTFFHSNTSSTGRVCRTSVEAIVSDYVWETMWSDDGYTFANENNGVGNTWTIKMRDGGMNIARTAGRGSLYFVRLRGNTPTFSPQALYLDSSGYDLTSVRYG